MHGSERSEEGTSEENVLTRLAVAVTRKDEVSRHYLCLLLGCAAGAARKFGRRPRRFARLRPRSVASLLKSIASLWRGSVMLDGDSLISRAQRSMCYVRVEHLV